MLQMRKVGRKRLTRTSHQLVTPITVTSDMVRSDGQLDYRMSDVRSRLVEQIAVSRWARNPPKTAEEWKRVCAGLGIHPQLLQDAIVVCRTVAPEDRSQRRVGGICIRLPEQIRGLFYSWCREREWAPSGAIASAVHEYLLGKAEPAYLTRRASHLVRKRLLRERGPGDRASNVFNVSVSFEAEQALARRATVADVSMSAVVKGLMMGIVDGSWPPPKRIYSLRDMRMESDLYLVPAAIRRSAQSRSEQTLAKAASTSPRDSSSTLNKMPPRAAKHPMYPPGEEAREPSDLDGQDTMAAAPIPGPDDKSLAAIRRAWPACLRARVLARTVPTLTPGIMALDTCSGAARGRPKMSQR